MRSDEEAGKNLTEKRRDLGEYLDKIEIELKAREQNLERIETEISKIEMKMSGLNTELALRTGDSNKVLLTESYKRNLKVELSKKNHERKELIEDVRRAAERKREVLTEIEELYSSTGVNNGTE